MLHTGALLAAAEGGGLVINGFWIIVSSLNFLFFLVVLKVVALGPLTRALDERRAKIEQGLKDADIARQEREAAADERQATLNEARREAKEILERVQKVADETRERELAETRAELERVRQQATAEIAAEKERALTEVRTEIADLALRAAGRVVGETLTAARERRLVEEFLVEVAPETGA
jgi:F-type H+-transporting ATPase subunit b